MLTALAVLVEAKTKPSVIIEAVLEQSGLLTELEASTDPQDEVRVENLKELVSASMEYEERPFEELGEDEEISLSGFLEKVSLVADADEFPDGEDHGGVVTLMTLHTAKGLEFPNSISHRYGRWNLSACPNTWMIQKRLKKNVVWHTLV
jgi:DNA helicase II / ATP-dependent DNA helicase PcrA